MLLIGKSFILRWGNDYPDMCPVIVERYLALLDTPVDTDKAGVARYDIWTDSGYTNVQAEIPQVSVWGGEVVGPANTKDSNVTYGVGHVVTRSQWPKQTDGSSYYYWKNFYSKRDGAQYLLLVTRSNSWLPALITPTVTPLTVIHCDNCRFSFYSFAG